MRRLVIDYPRMVGYIAKTPVTYIISVGSGHGHAEAKLMKQHGIEIICVDPNQDRDTWTSEEFIKALPGIKTLPQEWVLKRFPPTHMYQGQ